MAKCVCGREIKPKPHCTVCGSSNVYGTPSRNRYQKASDGVDYYIRTFHCRSCNTSFDDTSTCLAPPPRITKPPQYEKRFIADNNIAHLKQEAEHALINLTIERIRAGKKKLTRDVEKTYQEKYGISLSEMTGCAVEGEPIDPDGEPTLHLATLDDPNETGT